MNNFGQWLWLMIWWFFFIAYLIIFFQIIGDIIRDHAMSGWKKAVWIVALVLLPFLAALVYIIARGGSMAERQAKAVADSRAQAETYIRETAGVSSADSIAKAKELLDAGVIDDSEFAKLKAKALAS